MKVIARDRKRGRVLIEGVGFQRAGIMWFVEGENDRCREYDGYQDAPEQDSWMRFGTPEQGAETNRSCAEMIAEREFARKLRKRKRGWTFEQALEETKKEIAAGSMKYVWDGSYTITGLPCISVATVT